MKNNLKSANLKPNLDGQSRCNVLTTLATASLPLFRQNPKQKWRRKWLENYWQNFFFFIYVKTAAAAAANFELVRSKFSVQAFPLTSFRNWEKCWKTFLSSISFNCFSAFLWIVFCASFPFGYLPQLRKLLKEILKTIQKNAGQEWNKTLCNFL